MQVKEIIETLDIDVDKRLYQLTQKELQKLLSDLLKHKDKKSLANLISDEKYFEISDLIKYLEKKNKLVLFNILNEPKDEKDLRIPLRTFVKKEWEYSKCDVEVPLPNTERKIDVVGVTFGRRVVGANYIVAIEIKTELSMSAIDSAFSQATDYLDCSDFSYVAVSPYVFLKYSKVLLNKVKSHRKKIGLLLVDKMRVISVIREAKETRYDDEKYKEILAYFKKQSF